MDSDGKLLEMARDAAARLDGRWVADFDEIATFAEVLVATDFLASPRDVVDYFRSPSRWDPEHDVGEGRPAAPGDADMAGAGGSVRGAGPRDPALAPVQSR